MCGVDSRHCTCVTVSMGTSTWSDYGGCGDRSAPGRISAYDLTFPVDLSMVLIDEFRRRGLPHQTALLRCGHYSTGSVPFKYVDGYLLTKFLRNRL